MIPDIDVLRDLCVTHVSCTCLTCNENCSRAFVSIDEFAELDGCYCPAFDHYTEWKVDAAHAGVDEVDFPEVYP